jgi:hypothetical protein
LGAVPPAPGSSPAVSCQKIVLDLQLTDLPVEKINLRFAGRSLRRRTAALENTRRAVEQLLLLVVDLVRMKPELARRLGHPVIPDRRQHHLRLRPAPGQTLNPALCFLRVPFMSCSCAIGAF